MRKHVLFCVGMYLALSASLAGATTYHVYGGAPNTGVNWDTITSAVALANFGTGGDIISIDDSRTYTYTSTQYITAPNTSIVAASGQTPTISAPMTSNIYYIQGYGCRIGSRDGGTITFDGGNQQRRGINLNNMWPNTTGTKGPNWKAWDQASTTTFENLVFKNWGTNVANTSCYPLWLLTADSTTTAPLGTTVILRNIDIQIPAGLPSVVPTAANNYTFIRAHLTSGAVMTLENVRCNTFMGYVVSCGFEGSNYSTQWGTLNLKNCKFIYDDPAMINSARMGCPVATMGFGTPHPNGFVINMDNCYVRNDAPNANYIDPSRWSRSSDTNNAFGAVSLMDQAKNVLNVTNSAIVGCGSGVNIDTPNAAVTLVNSDIYVPTPASFTKGHFINISPRSAAASGNHQCTATRSNLYGYNGSSIQPSTRPVTSKFTMITCNDWSTTNSYASNWIKTSCVEPGRNPGYGAQNGEGNSPGIANADFTVYSQYIKGLNIGSDRDFNVGVPVEMSSFSIR